MSDIITITAPAYQPLTVNQVQDHLKAGTDDDYRLLSLIKEAHQWACNMTGRALMAEVREFVLDDFPDSPFWIDCAPVRSITSFTYTDCDGTATVWAASNYILDSDYTTPTCRRGRFSLGYSISWPSVTLRPIAGIRIRFAAGYSATTDAEAVQQAAVPSDIKEAMLRYIRVRYDHPDGAELLTQARVDKEALERIDTWMAAPLLAYRIWTF